MPEEYRIPLNSLKYAIRTYFVYSLRPFTNHTAFLYTDILVWNLFAFLINLCHKIQVPMVAKVLWVRLNAEQCWITPVQSVSRYFMLPPLSCDARGRGKVALHNQIKWGYIIWLMCKICALPRFVTGWLHSDGRRPLEMPKCFGLWWDVMIIRVTQLLWSLKLILIVCFHPLSIFVMFKTSSHSPVFFFFLRISRRSSWSTCPLTLCVRLISSGKLSMAQLP